MTPDHGTAPFPPERLARWQVHVESSVLQIYSGGSTLQLLLTPQLPVGASAIAGEIFALILWITARHRFDSVDIRAQYSAGLWLGLAGAIIAFLSACIGGPAYGGRYGMYWANRGVAYNVSMSIDLCMWHVQESHGRLRLARKHSATHFESEQVVISNVHDGIKGGTSARVRIRQIHLLHVAMDLSSHFHSHSSTWCPARAKSLARLPRSACNVKRLYR